MKVKRFGNFCVTWGNSLPAKRVHSLYWEVMLVFCCVPRWVPNNVFQIAYGMLRLVDAVIIFSLVFLVAEDTLFQNVAAMVYVLLGVITSKAIEQRHPMLMSWNMEDEIKYVSLKRWRHTISYQFPKAQFLLTVDRLLNGRSSRWVGFTVN